VRLNCDIIVSCDVSVQEQRCISSVAGVYKIKGVEPLQLEQDFGTTGAVFTQGIGKHIVSFGVSHHSVAIFFHR